MIRVLHTSVIVPLLGYFSDVFITTHVQDIWIWHMCAPTFLCIPSNMATLQNLSEEYFTQ